MDPILDEFPEWIAHFREGELSPDEAARLNDRLAADAKARELWACHLLMQIQLESELAIPDASILDASVPEPAAGQQTISPSGSPVLGSPVLGFLGGVVSYVGQSRVLMFWLTFGLLSTFFVAHFGTVLLGHFWAQQNAQLADVGAGDRKPAAADRAGLISGTFVARLTNAVDCRWNFAGAAKGSPDNDQLHAIALAVGTGFSSGQQLNLTDGLAEITFASGAKVILHGPTQFAVNQPLGGSLQFGKLMAKVPHSATGFTIDTPGGKVVDLGTEFGVKVNFDRTMHVIVYVGEVEINGQSGSGDGAQQPVRVHAGETVIVTPGQPPKPGHSADERFVRDLARLSDKGQAESAYVEFMKSRKPAVWFRMQGKGSERVLHDEMGGHDAKLVWDGPGNPFVKGPIGKSLWLRGTQLKDYAVVRDYPVAKHGMLSVTAWAWLDSRPRYATIVANSAGLGPNGQEQGQFHFGLTRQGVSLAAHVSQADGQTQWADEGPTHPFPLNQWQHVAFTTDGSTLRLYRQGREVAVIQHTGLLYPSPTKSLGIGARVGDPGAARGSDPCWWDGKLDEVAVFNDALTAEDIRKLADAAPR